MDRELDQNDDELELVLATLRALMTRVTRPVIRACLQDAHDDIVHLAERDIDPMEDLWPADAA
jgi:hypothetical protein